MHEGDPFLAARVGRVRKANFAQGRVHVDGLRRPAVAFSPLRVTTAIRHRRDGELVAVIILKVLDLVDGFRNVEGAHTITLRVASKMRRQMADAFSPVAQNTCGSPCSTPDSTITSTLPTIVRRSTRRKKLRARST